MREFTAEMLSALKEAHESVKGTKQYGKYVMETDCRSEKGRWFFVGHNIPFTTGTIKTFKGNTYIVTPNNRYHVSDAVKELLGMQ